MIEFLENTIAGTIAVAIIIGGIIMFLFGMGYLIQGVPCHKKAKLYESKTEWSFFTGCFIKKDGKMIPMELYEKMIMPNAVYGNAEQNIKVKIEQ